MKQTIQDCAGQERESTLARASPRSPRLMSRYCPSTPTPPEILVLVIPLHVWLLRASLPRRGECAPSSPSSPSPAAAAHGASAPRLLISWYRSLTLHSIPSPGSFRPLSPSQHCLPERLGAPVPPGPWGSPNRRAPSNDFPSSLHCKRQVLLMFPAPSTTTCFALEGKVLFSVCPLSQELGDTSFGFTGCEVNYLT